MKKIITAVSAMSVALGCNAENKTDRTDQLITDRVYSNMESGQSVYGSGMLNMLVSKSVALINDADGSNDVTAGDRLIYTVVTDNPNDFAVSGVFVEDVLDSHLMLELGFVTTSQGFVLEGNHPNDADWYLQVYHGVIQPDDFAVVHFEVTLDYIPPQIGVILNQAVVEVASVSAFFLSDDPSLPGSEDPTYIQVRGQLPDLIFEHDFETPSSVFI